MTYLNPGLGAADAVAVLRQSLRVLGLRIKHAEQRVPAAVDGAIKCELHAVCHVQVTLIA